MYNYEPQMDSNCFSQRYRLRIEPLSHLPHVSFRARHEDRVTDVLIANGRSCSLKLVVHRIVSTYTSISSSYVFSISKPSAKESNINYPSTYPRLALQRTPAIPIHVGALVRPLLQAAVYSGPTTDHPTSLTYADGTIEKQ